MKDLFYSISQTGNFLDFETQKMWVEDISSDLKCVYYCTVMAKEELIAQIRTAEEDEFVLLCKLFSENSSKQWKYICFTYF